MTQHVLNMQGQPPHGCKDIPEHMGRAQLAMMLGDDISGVQQLPASARRKKNEKLVLIVA